MKERKVPCVFYVCAGCDCAKGKKEVTMAKCQRCQKYQPRKTGNPRVETVKTKREKAKKKELNRYMKEV